MSETPTKYEIRSAVLRLPISRQFKLGLDEVRKKLAGGVYGERKMPVVEEWIHRKKEELNAPTYMFHPIEVPNAKVFPAHEAVVRAQQGWYDSPAKFPALERSPISDFWTKQWKRIILFVAPFHVTQAHQPCRVTGDSSVW